MSRWFRHYAGMMRDEKLVRVAVRSKQPVERVVWVWGAILESASEINDGGRYDFDPSEAAYFLRCDETDLMGVVSTLADLGHVADGVVAKWADRQFDSDKSRERQKRYRDRLAAQRDVTAPSPDADVTPQETETEADISSLRSDKPAARKRVRPERLAEDWTLPDEWRQDAINAGLSPSLIGLEASKMRDWSRSSKNGAKLDWRATWRNWCREAAARTPPDRGSPQRPETPVDVSNRILAEMRSASEQSGTHLDGHQPAVVAIPSWKHTGTG